MNNLIFTLTSPAGGGKDVCGEMIASYCEHLELKPFRLAYGDFVKILCARNFGYESKDTDRHILQEFGTQVREIEKDFWVRQVMNTVDMLRNTYDVFIIPDARYENEMQPSPYKLSYPFINVYVKRDFDTKLGDSEYSHESEAMANNPDLSKFHYVIDNNGSLESTYMQIADMINDVIVKREKLLNEQRGIIDMSSLEEGVEID